MRNRPTHTDSLPTLVASILDSCALRPDSRSVFVSVEAGKWKKKKKKKKKIIARRHGNLETLRQFNFLLLLLLT